MERGKVQGEKNLKALNEVMANSNHPVRKILGLPRKAFESKRMTSWLVVLFIGAIVTIGSEFASNAVGIILGILVLLVATWSIKQSGFRIYHIIKFNRLLSSILWMLIFIISILSVISIIMLISLAFQPDKDIYIQPFNANADKNLSGDTIANLLRFDLQKIKAINEQDLVASSFQPNALNSEVSAPSKNSPQAFNYYMSPISSGTNPINYRFLELGTTVSTGGISLSVGQVLFTLKEHIFSERTITGGIQKSDPDISVIAFLYDPYNQGSVTSWEVKRSLPRDSQSYDELITAMVEDLAFQIANDLSKRGSTPNENYPHTSQAFKYLTLCREADHRYNATLDIKDLSQALDFVYSAKRIEPDYLASSKLLSGLGITYSNLNAYNEAEQIFQNVSDLDPAEGAFDLGTIYFMQGRYSKAIDSYSRATQFNPHYSDAWGNKGNALNIVGRYNESIQAYDKVIEIDPRDARAWNNKGLILTRLGKYNESIKAFDKAIELNPQNWYQWINKGIALGIVGRYNESIQAYNRAIDILNETIEINPSNATTWYNKAATLLYLGKYNESIVASDSTIQLNPNYAMAWVNKGDALGVRGMYNESIQAYNRAIDIFNETIEINPKDELAWNNKGLILTRLGKYNESIKAFDKAIELDPNYARACGNKGLSLKILGRFNKSIEAFDRTIKLSPQYALPWRDKGLLLRLMGKYNESIKASDKAIELDPRYAVSWADKAYSLFALGKYNESIKYVDEAIKLDPKNAEYWRVKGISFASLKDYNNSVSALGNAINLAPANGELWTNLGDVYYGLGQYNNSIKSYDRAIELNQSNGDAWDKKSISLQALGRDLESLNAYTMAKKLGLSNAELMDNMASAFYLSGKYNESIEASDRAIKENPKYSVAWIDKSATLRALHRNSEADSALAMAYK